MSPNPELWHYLRYSAYKMTRGTDLVDWHRRVLDKARLLNDLLGNRLSSSTLEGMAQRTANWIWCHLLWEYDEIPGNYHRAIGRKGGLASGEARRRGTPLEDDPTPWITLEMSRYFYYRYFRFADERPENPKPRPKPWIELDITNAAFRQRLRRARAGKYPDADQGRPPWDYVQVSEELWWEFYAPKPPRNPDGHGFQTEELIAAGVDPGSSPDRCCETEPPIKDGAGSAGAGEQPRAPRNRPLEYAIAAGVDEYLSMREPAHYADLLRLRLPQYGLRRPMPPFDDYNPRDPEHRQRYAIAKRGVESRNLRVAKIIHAKEMQLGLAQPVPPWVAVKQKIAPDIQAWGGDVAPHGRSATWARNLARDLVAEQYPSAEYVSTPEDVWPEFLRACCGTNCGAPLTPPQILCDDCLALAMTRVPCPNCGGDTAAFTIAGMGECMECVSATAEEHAVRTNAILRAWLRFQKEHRAVA